MAQLPKQAFVYLPELFSLIEKCETRIEKRELLVQYAQKDKNHEQCIKNFMELMWHPLTTFELPEGAPPYAPATEIVGEAPSSLFRVFKVGNISRVIKASGDYIPNLVKRENFFVQLLESLEKTEAELLIMIKDKTVHEKYPSITCDLFCQVFGGTGWLPKEVVEANPPKEDEPVSKKSTGGSKTSKKESI